ncbi:MAG: QueT transporter family protein [Candidatus Bathyarchaeota archaeon]|nr:QueT transporter family protein [Candidatus Bathyarchaeota archaeon]
MVDSKDVALAAVFTSLYFAFNLLQAATIGNPAISGAVQLRVADCLISVTALLGWPVMIGVTLGGLLTNAYAFISPVDLAFGPIANLLAAGLVLLLRRHQLFACVVAALPIGAIVGGGYLWWYFPPPEIFGLVLPTWAAMMISITLSSLIATAVIGYALLKALSRPGIKEPLKSRGLKVYS